MKRIESKSPFWSRLLGLLIAFAIIAVLVFGGVENLLGELSAANDALAASQYELGKTQQALATTQSELVASRSELTEAQMQAAHLARSMQHRDEELKAANSKIVVLNHARDQLKQRWGYTLQALAQRNEQLMATDSSLRATQAELEQLRNQPQWSMIVTSERQMQQSYRERFAASHVRVYAEGESGLMFYDGQEALHEVEQYLAVAERTQVVLTTTAPGRDVLTCLNNPSLGCGTIVAAGVQASHMQAYAYESQYSSMETLMVDGRRGRRPGRRR